MVGLFLAQSEEDARRLVAMGARAESVRVVGNLKYDVRAARESRVAELIKEAAGGRPIVVAGSTVERLKDNSLSEEEMVIQAWEGTARREFGALLVIAGVRLAQPLLAPPAPLLRPAPPPPVIFDECVPRPDAGRWPQHSRLAVRNHR